MAVASGMSCPAPTVRAALRHKFESLPRRLRAVRIRSPFYLAKEERGMPLPPPQSMAPPSTFAPPSFMVMSAFFLVLLILRRRLFAQKSLPRAAAVHQGGDGALSTSRQRRTKKQPIKRPPIQSLTAAVDQIKAHADAYQFFEAGDLLDELRAALDAKQGLQFFEAATASKMLSELLADGLLESRIQAVREATQALNGDDGFSLVKEDSTMRMMQRMAPDRTLTIKIDAVLEGVRPADTLFIWREGHLYPLWFPLVSKGVHIAHRHPAEALLHIIMDVPLIFADLVLWGVGCDSFERDGTLLICVKSVKQSAPPDTPLPPLQASRGLKASQRVRADINVLFEPLSPTSVRFAFMFSHKVKAGLPQWLVDFVLQNGMAKIFSAMKRVAVRMAADDADCEHVAHVNSPQYAPVATWVRSRVDGFLATLPGA